MASVSHSLFKAGTAMVPSAGQESRPIPSVGTCEWGERANLVAVASNGLSDVAGLDGIAVSLDTTGRSALFPLPLLGFGRVLSCAPVPQGARRSSTCMLGPRRGSCWCRRRCVLRRVWAGLQTGGPLSRIVVLNEGCRNGMAEGIPCLRYHILPHKKSQIHQLCHCLIRQIRQDLHSYNIGLHLHAAAVQPVSKFGRFFWRNLTVGFHRTLHTEPNP